MRSFLLRVAAMAAILAPACGQDTVRINNTTKAVISPVPFRVGQSAVDPTAPGNGSIWYDTATNALKARVNGATISLGTTTITGANNQVMFFDGANTPAGDAGMTYNKTTDTLTVSNLDAAFITGDVTVDGDITVGSINLTGPITFPDDVRNVFNPGATVAGLNVGGFAGNPSTPINGDIWYDSVANTLDARINGATVNLGAGGSGTPGGADTQVQVNNAGAFDGSASLTFNIGTGLLTAEDLTVTAGAIFNTLQTGSAVFPGATSGTSTLQAPAIAGSAVITLPAATGTLVSNVTLGNSTLPGAFTTLSASGAITSAIGSSGTPALGPGTSGFYFSGAAGNTYFTNSGIYQAAVTTNSFQLKSAGSFGFEGAGAASPIDVILVREAAATLQLGYDAATGINQKLKAMDASAGTGGNLTLAGGNGSGTGGALVLAGGTGTATAGGVVNVQTAVTTTLVDAARFDASTTATHTRFFLYDVDNATLERVTVGAADTGGAGFKVLRIPN